MPPHVQAGVSSFEDAVQYYLGKRVSRTSVVVSNCIILGAVIVYHILMQVCIVGLSFFPAAALLPFH